MADEEKKPAEAKKPHPAAIAAKKAAANKGAGQKIAVEDDGPQPPPKVRLRSRYEAEIVPKLMEQLKLKNKMAVPRLTKICLNVGFGKAATDNQPKAMEQCVNDLCIITGQKAVVTKTRKSISNFKLRAGMTVGCRVTLRGPRMWEFFDRLVSVAIPRIRDFRGLSPRAFDGRGNYSMGLQEQTVFPEIEGDRVEYMHGMDITICTTAFKSEHAFALLKAMGMPFRER